MKDVHSISWLVGCVEQKINEILKVNLYEAGLREDEIEHLRERKNELRCALNNCGIGDLNAKSFVKGVIKDIFENSLKYEAKDYDSFISFDMSNKLSKREKFDILMHHYKKKYGDRALETIIEKSEILKKTNIEEGYNLKDEDIERIYHRERPFLSYEDKRDITIQRVYSDYRGLGVIDDIRDMRIDGVSGGVSGIRDGVDGIWIFYKGININLSCLSFGSAWELERVCMNIYRYGSPGQLSKSKGYIIGEMKDRSRVVVVRPPFSESFAFFVRKFGTIENKAMEELLVDEDSECVIDVIKWIVKGCQITAITGAQGSGKTTLLMSLIRYISPHLTLRIQEMAFELHLRDIYPDRNILTFRETDYIDGQMGLDVQKKTDGAVNILGEVATIQVAAYLIQMSQVGSLFTLFTHHAKTTESLIKYMRNSLLSCGLFRDERIAREQVVEAIRFDIHMEKDIYGHRYIERVSEIVEDCSEQGYHISDIIIWKDGKYIQKNNFSVKSLVEISKHLSKEEREIFEKRYGLCRE